MDAADFNPSEPFEIGDRRAKRVAIEGIFVQRLDVQNELAALGLCHRRDDRDLAAKFISGAGLLCRCPRPLARAATRLSARVGAALGGAP